MSEIIGEGATKVLARITGPAGEIVVLEDPATGARLYREAGVCQSYVLPGGEPGIAYIKVMAHVLDAAGPVVLFGCGGGVLASALHRRGGAVVVVDSNSRSFDIARRFFWMPPTVACVADTMHAFLQSDGQAYAAIGIDLGGPDFEYADVFDAAAFTALGRRLAADGVVAINIASDWAEADTVDAVSQRLQGLGRTVWICEETRAGPRNFVVVAPSAAFDGDYLDVAAARLGFRTTRV